MVKARYEQLGASATKAGLFNAMRQAGVGLEENYFARLNFDLAGSSEHCCAVHCDGAGTKCLVAYLCYREGADVSVFAGLSQDALVMNLDDLYCVGAPESLIVANAIARNRSVIPDSVIEVLIGSYKSLSEKLSAWGLNLELAGGETADCGDLVRTLLVDATIAARYRKECLIDTRHLSAGDVIVGVSSTAKASYEEKENTGIASNGLTLARHVLFSKEMLRKYPECADQALQEELCYSGPFLPLQELPELGMSVGEALLSPTRTYAPFLEKLYKERLSQLHAVIHLTGGGQTKVLRFARPGLAIVKDSLFEIPPLFRLIQRVGDLAWEEMYQVFNMGHRLELYTEEKNAAAIISLAQTFSLPAKIIGHVKEHSCRDEKELQLHTVMGSFVYHG